MDDKNSSSSINPWPSRGSKRDEDSASERGHSDLVSFDNSVKDEGQSCGSSTDGLTVKKEDSTFGSQSSKFGIGTKAGFSSGGRKSFGFVSSEFGTSKTSGFGMTPSFDRGFGSKRDDDFNDITNIGSGRNTTTGGDFENPKKGGFGNNGFNARTSSGFDKPKSSVFGNSSFGGFGTTSSGDFFGNPKSGFGNTSSGGFGNITSGGFGNITSGGCEKSKNSGFRVAPNDRFGTTSSSSFQKQEDEFPSSKNPFSIKRYQEQPKVETQSTKSENLLTKDSGLGSYYAQVDGKEFGEPLESHSPSGKKETLYDENREHHNNNTPRKRRSRKNTRYEKCYHCQQFGHFSKYCPDKEMFGDSFGVSGLQNRNNGDSNNAKGFRSRLNRNSGNDFSAYRYNDRDDKQDRDKGDDQLTKHLDAIFPIVQGDDDNKTPQKLQPINANNRVPINSLRSGNNSAFQQLSQSPRSVNLNLDGLCINPLVAPTSSNRENNNAYHTIETRRKTTTKNGQEIEEWTSIKFPASLPPNIKVITAHLLPTQVLDD